MRDLRECCGGDHEQPTAAEVQEHEISGHDPYRSWCRACISGRGRADAHVGRPAAEKGVPIIGADNRYLWRPSTRGVRCRHRMRLQV